MINFQYLIIDNFRDPAKLDVLYCSGTAKNQ